MNDAVVALVWKGLRTGRIKEHKRSESQLFFTAFETSTLIRLNSNHGANMSDPRRHAPPAQRNREPIAEILRKILPANGTVLEIASGSGEHAIHFAKAFPTLIFQPSDPSLDALASIEAWRLHEDLQNLRSPVQLDAAAQGWPVTEADALLCINMIHISPRSATEGLMRGAATLLAAGAPLFLYGPYQRGGNHTAPSNAAFDEDLRRRNAEWGIRDLEAVTDCARQNGFTAPDVYEMPANNLSLVFWRQ